MQYTTESIRLYKGALWILLAQCICNKRDKCPLATLSAFWTLCQEGIFWLYWLWDRLRGHLYADLIEKQNKSMLVSRDLYLWRSTIDTATHFRVNLDIFINKTMLNCVLRLDQPKDWYWWLSNRTSGWFCFFTLTHKH